MDYQWSLTAANYQENNFLSSQSLHGWSGANGVFSFPIRELLNWSDRNLVKLTFSFQSKSDLQDDLLYTLFDYIRLYTNFAENQNSAAPSGNSEVQSIASVKHARW